MTQPMSGDGLMSSAFLEALQEQLKQGKKGSSIPSIVTNLHGEQKVIPLSTVDGPMASELINREPSTARLKEQLDQTQAALSSDLAAMQSNFMSSMLSLQQSLQMSLSTARSIKHMYSSQSKQMSTMIEELNDFGTKVLILEKRKPKKPKPVPLGMYC